MRYALFTFGCRVNQADSFDVDRALRDRGAVASRAEDADLIIVNTCTVTGAADQGARQAIRRIARQHGRARIVVTGCAATRAPGDFEGLPNVIGVAGNNNKARLADWLDERGGFTAGDRAGASEGGGAVEPGTMGRTSYPLRVQTGCDESCAFCVVPSTRGRSRSRPADDVLAEVRRLTAAGYREVWLVGVHLGSYGRDLTPRSSLLALARAVDRTAGDVIFRFGSIEPMDCPEGLVDLVARSGRFAPHLHLPLQHASDRILAAMRRPYTFAQYRRLVAHARDRLPDAALGADVVAGFPGETEREADEAVEAIAALPLTSLHVFPYSDRPGTTAAAMTPKVAPATISARARRLRELGDALHDRFVRERIGTVRPALALHDGTVVLTDNFLKVRVAPGLARNTRTRVRIDSADGGLRGTVVTAESIPD